MTSAQIDRLVHELEHEFARGGRGASVAELLAAYARAHDDWRTMALFDSSLYTRNLVHRSEEFELLLLCWEPGQVTPIHNHQGQRCWMGVLDGAVQETLFRTPAGAGALVPGAVRDFQRGAVAFIADELGLHRIAPIGERRAVSLHLYSRPIPQCQVYDPSTGEISLRTLRYYSRRGVRVQGDAMSA